MKNLLLFLFAAVTLAFTSCSKDDDDFKLKKDQIYGTWEVTHMLDKNSNYIPWILGTTTATFNSDGTYLGAGYFGTGTGTYKISGNVLTCYVEGSEFASYNVISLKNGIAELKMDLEEIHVQIKCKKQ